MQLSSRKDPRIQQFKDRLTAFVPHIMFDTTFDAEQKLQAFALGFGAFDAHAEVLVDERQTVINMGVQFDNKPDFLFFPLTIANHGCDRLTLKEI